MARGERFELNFDDDEDHRSGREEATAGPLGFNLVKDIAERPVDGSAVARPPSPRTTTTGFPEPKIKPLSRFKQKQQASQGHSQGPTNGAKTENDIRTKDATNGSGKDTLGDSERQRIDRENKEVLARMSEDQIARERADLLAGGVPGLTPSLIERLLKRANLQDGGDAMLPPGHEDSTHEAVSHLDMSQKEPIGSDFTSTSTSTKPRPKVTFADSASREAENAISTSTLNDSTSSKPKPTASPLSRPPPLHHDPESAPLHPPPDLQPARSSTVPSSGPSIHFPKPIVSSSPSSSTKESLDPNSSTFLTDLRNKYFPDLTADPSTLAWMQPLPSATSAENTSYSPSHEALPPSALRFDFRGALVPPSVAATLPTTLGLHHHAAAPASAGYTIGELARLQRSVVPAQRAAAHQTLGRIIYRLGKGLYGEEGTELCEGLWNVLSNNRVIESLTAEAGRDELASNRTAWAAATEGVWLWRKAGGRGGEEGKTR